MPPRFVASGPLFPAVKENRTPRFGVHSTSQVNSPRRIVKPLGEHKPENSSPSLGSPRREKRLQEEKTPRAKKATSARDVLTRRIADDVHGPCSLATNTIVGTRSPSSGSPLNRIAEEGYQFRSRHRKGVGSILRSKGEGDDRGVQKKVFANIASSEKDVSRKEKIGVRAFKRKEFSRHFAPNAKEHEMPTLVAKALEPSIPRGFSNWATLVEGDSVSDEALSQLGEIENLTSPELATLPEATKQEMVAGDQENYDKESASEMPGPSKSPEFIKRGAVRCPVAEGIVGLPKEVQIEKTPSPQTSEFGYVAYADAFECDNLTPSPQHSISPEFKKRVAGLGAGESYVAGVTVDFQESILDKERSRFSGAAYFEDFENESMIPLPQPSKSPEVRKRGLSTGAAGSSVLGTTSEHREDGLNEGTPPPQTTHSPEFIKRGLVLATGGCFGAGPMMGPEGMGSVKDRRKCKPRGILTIEADYFSSSSSAEFIEQVQFKQAIPVPAMASVEWMVTEEYDINSLDHQSVGDYRENSAVDMSSSLQVSPTSFSHMVRFDVQEPSPVAEEEDVTERVFWKDGLLQQWEQMQVLDTPVWGFTDLPMRDKREDAAVAGSEGLSELSCGKPQRFPSPSRHATEVETDPITGQSCSPDSAKWCASPPSYHFDSHCAVELSLLSTSRAHSSSRSQDANEWALDADSKRELLVEEEVPQHLCLGGSIPVHLENSPDACTLLGRITSDVIGQPSVSDVPVAGSPVTEDLNVHKRDIANSSGSGWESGCELLDSKDGSFEYQSPLTEEETSPRTPYLARAHAKEEIGMVDGASKNELGFCHSTGGASVVCTPGPGALVEVDDSPQRLNDRSTDLGRWVEMWGGKKTSKIFDLQGQLSGPLCSRNLLHTRAETSGGIPAFSNDGVGAVEVEVGHHVREVRGSSAMVSSSTVAKEGGIKLSQGMIKLQQADYCPSSLLRADALSKLTMLDAQNPKVGDGQRLSRDQWTKFAKHPNVSISSFQECICNVRGVTQHTEDLRVLPYQSLESWISGHDKRRDGETKS